MAPQRVASRVCQHSKHNFEDECCFLDIVLVPRIITFLSLVRRFHACSSMSKNWRCASCVLHQHYAPGAVDYHTGDFRQVEPLEVRATAELVEGQIRISGELHTRLEMVCARCLEPVLEEVSRDLTCFTGPCSRSPGRKSSA